MRVESCVFLVLAYSLAVFAAPSDLTVKEQSERILEDQVIAVLECAREILKAGVPDHNIPSFDPLYAEEVAVDLDSLGVNGLSGYVSLSYFLISGVTDFVHSDVQGTINLFPPSYNIKAKLTIPALLAEAKEYAIDVKYSPADLHVYGAGKFSLELENFWAQVEATVSLIPIALSSVSVSVGVDAVSSLELTGLYHDDELSAQIVQSILADPEGFLALYGPIAADIALDIAGGDGAGSEFFSYVQDHCL